MHEKFGARLRQRRLDQGIALSLIAEQTKIKHSLLEALERDDVSHWPAGIFRRAYIRTYAQAIGLDPDVIVREFLEAHPEPQEVFETALAGALATGARMDSGPPTRLRTLVGSALGSLSRLARGPIVREPSAAATALDPRPTEPCLAVPLEVPDVHAHLLGPPEMADDAPVQAVQMEAAPAAEPDAPATAPEVTVAPARQEAPPAPGPQQKDGPDLFDLAQLCTDFVVADTVAVVEPLLQEAARLVGASGLIVWIWDESIEGLTPALAYGYSDRVLAQLPTVKSGDDNPTAGAFRTGRAWVTPGSSVASGAIVVPLPAPSGSVGVLALEVPNGDEREEAVRAVAAIVAALIAQFVTRAPTTVSEPGEDVMVCRSSVGG